MLKRQKGFTLIELLIVVAIIGIIAAIAIPNLLNAIDRGKQKRTMADLRSIATATESYAIDYNRYPISMSGPVGGNATGTISPTYIKQVPPNDGWANVIQWTTDATGGTYTVESYGKDGISDASVGATTNFNNDITFVDGSFTAWPEGAQT
ncbi:MAG: prepilin-type N-terminal cleavage/methylation domain-containing protein [Acidobacteriota bacterium]